MSLQLDPCESNPCGVDAVCKVLEGNPSCSCPQGMTGDPYVKCGTFQSGFVPYSTNSLLTNSLVFRVCLIAIIYHLILDMIETTPETTKPPKTGKNNSFHFLLLIK